MDGYRTGHAWSTKGCGWLQVCSIWKKCGPLDSYVRTRSFRVVDVPQYPAVTETRSSWHKSTRYTDLQVGTSGPEALGLSGEYTTLEAGHCSLVDRLSREPQSLSLPAAGRFRK